MVEGLWRPIISKRVYKTYGEPQVARSDGLTWDIPQLVFHQSTKVITNAERNRAESTRGRNDILEHEEQQHKRKQKRKLEAQAASDHRGAQWTSKLATANERKTRRDNQFTS